MSISSIYSTFVTIGWSNSGYGAYRSISAIRNLDATTRHTLNGYTLFKERITTCLSGMKRSGNGTTHFLM